MMRDLFFVLIVLSISVYAHTNKEMIISFIEVLEEERKAVGSFENR